MTRALKLISDVLRLKLPPKALAYGLFNRLSHSLRTGNRRFEFERLYLEDPDPWRYRTKAYELEKYQRTLECALAWRSASRRALEYGCSIGVFSQLVARHFDLVTAVDFSKEALEVAREYNYAEKNITFLREDLMAIELDERFDVIFCAEVLYYLDRQNSDLICCKLEDQLAIDGIIVSVTGEVENVNAPQYFDGWDRILSLKFNRIFYNVVNEARPYQISVYCRRS